MNSSNFMIKRCGIKVSPPCLVIIYRKELKTRQHIIQIPIINMCSVNEVYTNITNNDKHKKLLDLISNVQLFRLLATLKDICNGIPISESLKKSQEIEKLSSNEDLNCVDSNILERKKAIMNQSFEKSHISPKDVNFVYNKEVEFLEVPTETSAWDSDEYEF